MIEAHPADDLHDSAEHGEADRAGVLPLRSRLKIQRQLADARGVIRERDRRREIGLSEEVARRAVSGDRHAGGMRQDVLQRDLTIGRDQPHARATRIVGHVPDRDLRTLELRNEFRHRIVQNQLALFHEHQDGDGGNGLGHRCQAKQRVGAQRDIGFKIRCPLRLEMHDLALACDEGHDPAQILRIDVALDQGANAAQTFGREADVFRFGDGHLPSCRV